MPQVIKLFSLTAFQSLKTWDLTKIWTKSLEFFFYLSKNIPHTSHSVLSSHNSPLIFHGSIKSSQSFCILRKTFCISKLFQTKNGSSKYEWKYFFVYFVLLFFRMITILSNYLPQIHRIHDRSFTLCWQRYLPKVS